MCRVLFWVFFGSRWERDLVTLAASWASTDLGGSRNSLEDAFTAVDYLAAYRTLQEQVSIKMSTTTASKIALLDRKAIFSVSTY